MHYQIGFLEQTRHNLIIQRQAMMEGVFDSAELLNDYTVSAELPYQNNQLIEEIYINYWEEETASDTLVREPSVIINNYSQLMTIASQCPAAGGPAVIRARAMLALVNDSLIYDDINACLQVGIYREMLNQTNNFDIELIPNPASDLVTIRLKNLQTGFCDIVITDMLGNVVKVLKADCEKAEHVIKTHELVPGVYLVKVSYETKEKVEKLILIK